MQNETGISRWQGLAVVLALCVLGLDAAGAAETDRRRAERPNHVPEISGAPQASGKLGLTYSFQPTASDPDGDRLSFWIRNRPNWAKFDSRTGELRGTPNQPGAFRDVVIGVSDWGTSDALAPFTIQVDAPAPAVNEPPVIGGTPAGSALAGQPYSFTPSASDPEGARLSFAIDNRPAWASFDASSGRLSGTPTAANAGTYGNIVISVTDGTSFTSLAPFGIQVTAPPNTAPVISGSPAGSVTAGQPYVFTPGASDADGDALTFSVSDKPAWASFDSATGRLNGTPGTANVGTSSVIVISVSDGQLSAALPAFSIEVTAVPNGAPTISGSPTTSVTEGQAYSFTPSASDPDGDALVYSIQNRPVWATFSSSSGRLSGTPGSTHVGSYPNIVISVSDGQASAALAAFSIQVNEIPNRAPTITGTPATSVTEGQAYSFTPTGSDPDGDVLVYSIQNRPVWATFSSSNGRLSGTPGSAHVGSYTGIVISVSDGTVSAALPTFSIAVADAPNRAPVLTGTPPSTVFAGDAYSFSPSASDPDGDRLTFSISGKPSWASFDSTTGRLNGTPGTANVGTTGSIVISASDGQATTSLPAFSIRVDQPVVRSVTLSWQAPTQNEDGTPLTDLTGFEVFYGQAPGQYSQTLPLPSAAMTSVTIEDLAPATWYFAVKAVNSAGTHSSFSNEAWKIVN